jgi:hypothetical protein
MPESNANDRTIRLRAAHLRSKLLKGVPPDSTVRDIIARMSNEELIRRDDEATAAKVARLAKKDPGKIVG